MPLPVLFTIIAKWNNIPAATCGGLLPEGCSVRSAIISAEAMSHNPGLGPYTSKTGLRAQTVTEVITTSARISGEATDFKDHR